MLFNFSYEYFLPLPGRTQFQKMTGSPFVDVYLIVAGTKDDLSSRGNGGKTGMTMNYFEYSLNSIIYSFFDSFIQSYFILFYFIKFRKL